MSESNSRTQPRNLKVAYEDTFGNFHGKFQPAPRRWRHDSRGPSLARMQLNLHPVYIMQIHCLPLLLRLRDTFALSRHSIENEERRRRRRGRFRASNSFVSPDVETSSRCRHHRRLYRCPRYRFPSGFVFKGMISSLRRGSHLATVSKLSMLIAAVTELSGRSETIR